MPLSPQITITPEDITFKSFDISAVTYTTTTATYTATGHTFSNGDIVMITGLAPDDYNGTYTITGTATNTFTVANTANKKLTDQTGNAYWSDPTEYEYDGGQSVTYIPDSVDLNTDLAAVEVMINGKNKIYRQTTAPTGDLVEGDIWFDTDDGNKQYYWTGSAWVSVQDDAIAAARAVADSKIKTFYQTSAPTATGAGDIWFDTDDGYKQYYWTGTAWTSVQDTAIAAAASAASAAQSTADGKNKVFRQGTTPTAIAIGDIWFNTSSDNAISRWDGSSWVSTTLGTNALANFSANKITSGTIDASVVTVSNINAGNISTGTLAAARIATGSLDASKITSGTITATQIASSTITGSLIAAATITASNIATGTITASQIATGTITATQIAAATITVDKLSAGTLTGFTVQTSSGSTAVILDGANNAISFKVGGSVVGNIVPWSSNGIYLHYGSTPSSSSYPALYVGSSTAVIAGSSTIDISSSSTGNSYNGTFTGYGDLNITSSYDFRVQKAYDTTTANAATVWISTTGQLRRSTASSQRYKTDIVDLISVPELDPKMLYSLPVRAFRFKSEHLPETDDRAGVLVPGFIAEEVDAIYPIAADYTEGKGVETWNDRILVPALLALVQDLNNRLKAIEGGN